MPLTNTTREVRLIEELAFNLALNYPLVQSTHVKVVLTFEIKNLIVQKTSTIHQKKNLWHRHAQENIIYTFQYKHQWSNETFLCLRIVISNEYRRFLARYYRNRNTTELTLKIFRISLFILFSKNYCFFLQTPLFYCMINFRQLVSRYNRPLQILCI